MCQQGGEVLVEGKHIGSARAGRWLEDTRSLRGQCFTHQRQQHDLGAAVLGGFGDAEVIRARGDILVCLDEVVGDLEASVGRLNFIGNCQFIWVAN